MDRINLALHLRRYTKMLQRRWFILAAGVALGLGLAGYRAYTTPNSYQAWSLLTLAPRVSAPTTSSAQFQEVLDKFYENQLQYMKSSVVKERVYKRLREDQTNTVFPAHSAEPVMGQGSSFRMVVTSTEFPFAQEFSKIWAREFMKFKDEQIAQTIDKGAANTQSEIVRYEAKLKKARQDLLDFLKDNNIGSVKETGDFAQQQLDQLLAEKNKYSTQRQLLENTTKEAIANGALDQASPGENSGAKSAATTQGSDPTQKFNSGSEYRGLKLQLLNKESELQRLSVTLKPKHPYMVDLRSDLAQINRRLQFELDMIEESRKALLVSYANNEKSYEPLIESQKKIVMDTRGIQSTYERFVEEEKGVKAVLENLERTLRSFDLGANNEGQFTIVEEGAGSPLSIGPNRAKMMLIGLMLGLGLGLGLVYFLHRLDDRLELAEEIEDALEEPVLGQIPQVDMNTVKEGRLLITRLSQHNMFSESIRGVRSAVMLGAGENDHRVLLVTSAVPGDGKTTFTVNFAATLAIAGHRVLLVDADLRRGNVNGYFNQDREPGLTEVLSGQQHWSDLLVDSEIPNLHVINTGSLPPNPGELLVSAATRQFLAEARNEYDYIIVDCPPLTAIDDTFALASMADGILFVVRAGQTSMRFAKTALNAVHQRGAKVLGIVLNGITSDNPYYYYNNYYHSYYNKANQPQPTQPLGSGPAPASQLAKPRNRLKSFSIEAQARARAGTADTETEEGEEKELTKAEQFRARRAAQRQSQGAVAEADQPVKKVEDPDED